MRGQWRAIGLLAMCVAAFGISACSDSSAEDVDATAPLVVDDNEPNSSSSSDDVVATTLTGKSFSLSDALAEKPVVLWFWAPG